MKLITIMTKEPSVKFHIKDTVMYKFKLSKHFSSLFLQFIRVEIDLVEEYQPNESIKHT